jgi:hypothetical protein
MRLKTSGRIAGQTDVDAVRRRLRIRAQSAVTAMGIVALAVVGLTVLALTTDDYAMYDTIGAPSL